MKHVSLEARDLGAVLIGDRSCAPEATTALPHSTRIQKSTFGGCQCFYLATSPRYMFGLRNAVKDLLLLHCFVVDT